MRPDNLYIVAGTNLQSAFYLHYWVWERLTPLPQVAEELKISNSKARRLLRDFTDERALNPKVNALYQKWKLNQTGTEYLPRAIYEAIKTKLREVEVLLSYVRPAAKI